MYRSLGDCMSGEWTVDNANIYTLEYQQLRDNKRIWIYSGLVYLP